ncbi:MAG TPA: BatA domain-containing protein [Vicinamibacterales bacterium]|nr:BatA domain-containing protein [Vicinamibacterales bacterium]
MLWLQPLAWVGLAALAIPLLIHLLMRQQSRQLLFPSLRFIRATQHSALRRHALSDWLLLAVRVGILAAAVAALAAPVWVSQSRRDRWSVRVARAIVVAPHRGADPEVPVLQRLIADEQASSFVSEVFRPPRHLGDGVRDAELWLRRQPPASHDVVIVGDLRAGAMTGSDLDVLPASTSVRVIPLPASDKVASARLTTLAERVPGEAGAAAFELELTVAEDTTAIARRPAPTQPPPPVTVRASEQNTPRVNAALRAVFAEGIVLPRQPRRPVVIEFDGGKHAATSHRPDPFFQEVLERLPEMRGREDNGVWVVATGMGGDDQAVVQAVDRVVRAVTAEDLQDLEAAAIPRSTLAQWSRPSRALATDLTPANEGDARVLWAIALVLLGVETLLRARRG